ncbi:MAG TPA: DUF433 domain-containing protein [Bacteroidales bacterium]|nr:DUF433 domain-containing protein [Bacteroidales bacterium]
MQNLNSRIIIDEKICNGKPTIKGTRITANTIIEYLSAGDSEEEILKQYPSIQKEDIQACLQFAADLMSKNFTIKPVA